ncbi:MAG: SDR family oxidoreductase [Desulfobacteraceae bacterium]|nr:MAG: SDR family oxidoreductase [Desulfobacteraceae bacterium]
MNLLILGANSDVAYAVAGAFAGHEKASILLASRNMELLEKKVQDLTIRYGVEVSCCRFDVTDFESHASFYASLATKPDVVVYSAGYMPATQEEAQKNYKEALKILAVNFSGAAAMLEVIAADFERRGHGTIIGISSVAGERGRQSNYIYGSSKAAFNAYLSGMRNRLCRRGVHVMTVLPGFIHTKMTEGLDLPGLLTAKPEEVAEDIYRAFRKKKDILYTKWFWRWIMAVIKGIPEMVFKRMSL